MLTGCSLQVGLDEPDPSTTLDIGAMADFAPDGPGTLTDAVASRDAEGGSPPDVDAAAVGCGPARVECLNPLGTTACTDGACAPSCAPGADDADGDPDNGCETLRVVGGVCGALKLPASVTAVVGDVVVCPHDGSEAGGTFRLQAGRVLVRGLIDAKGAGHGGGGGGGGGAGGSLGTGRGLGGARGEGIRDGGAGAPGAETTDACCGGCGGPGGTGGTGGGQHGGRGGVTGEGGGVGGRCRQDGREGGRGGDGADGGYLVAGGNGDESTDNSVHRGSAGGGAGGGGGCQGQAWSACMCPDIGSGGGGGGGGGAGGRGGGLVALTAAESIRVEGRIDTRGMDRIAGADGEDGAPGACPEAGGGRGGDGAPAGGGPGNNRGGDGGELSIVCGIDEHRGPAGDGGHGGRGAGGGVLLSAPLVEIPGAVNALGGGGEASNGGTVKLLHCGAVVQAGELFAGRQFDAPLDDCP